MLMTTCTIALPISAAEGYGSLQFLFLLCALACLCTAIVGALLCMMLFKNALAQSREEADQLTASAQVAMAESERRVEQMNDKLERMLQQQTALMEMLETSRTQTPDEQSKPTNAGEEGKSGEKADSDHSHPPPHTDTLPTPKDVTPA